ncbi:MAG: hypothetical protein Q7T48_04105 [Cellvibrio sp.]|uniref:hypothetical protein n=1 Tax=Cellvibrio sp. TaxID=1965322 RepID=UPI00271BD04B|nr:hypothetical protein [Cellvibrio sp.]
MKKILISLAALLLCLSGCKGEDGTPTNAIKNHQFQWASFEQHKIKRIIDEKLVADTKLPDELNFDENDLNRKRSNLNNTIRQLEKTGKEKCDAKLLPADANASLPEKIRNLQGGVIVTDSAWDKYHEIRSSKEYIDCVMKERNSKEILDLQTSLDKEDDLRSKRAKFIENIKRGTDDVLRKMVADYAQENQLSLVILRQSDSIIYNENSGVLDITNELEAYINTKMNQTKTDIQ